MRFPTLGLVLILLTPIVNGYPPRYAHHRGQLHHHHRHKHRHERARDYPSTETVITFSTQLNSTRGELKKEKSLRDLQM